MTRLLAPLALIATIPLSSCSMLVTESIATTGDNGKIVYQDADIRDVLEELARESNLNIVLHPSVRGRISCSFERRPARERLRSIVHSSGHILVHELENGLDVYHVVPRANLRRIKRTGRESRAERASDPEGLDRGPRTVAA